MTYKSSIVLYGVLVLAVLWGVISVQYLGSISPGGKRISGSKLVGPKEIVGGFFINRFAALMFPRHRSALCKRCSIFVSSWSNITGLVS